MDAQDGVVWLNHRSSDLWARPDSERNLGFLAVVNGQPFQHKAPQTRSSATSHSLVDHESLQASAVVSQLADPIQTQIDDLLTDSVMPASEVVRRIFLTTDQLLRVEQLTIGTWMLSLLSRKRDWKQENANRLSEEQKQNRDRFKLTRAI